MHVCVCVCVNVARKVQVSKRVLIIAGGRPLEGQPVRSLCAIVGAYILVKNYWIEFNKTQWNGEEWEEGGTN